MLQQFVPRLMMVEVPYETIYEQIDKTADGIPVLGWREVPVNPAALGPTAQASCPVIRQVLVGRPALTIDEASNALDAYIS